MAFVFAAQQAPLQQPSDPTQRQQSQEGMTVLRNIPVNVVKKVEFHRDPLTGARCGKVENNKQGLARPFIRCS
jgi:hypothetical protein